MPINFHLHNRRCTLIQCPGGGGFVTHILFGRGVPLKPRNPYPFLRVIFLEIRPIFHNLRVFFWVKILEILKILKKDPFLMVFLSKMGPLFKDIVWKSHPLERHTAVCLNMWVPHPPDPMLMRSKDART